MTLYYGALCPADYWPAARFLRESQVSTGDAAASVTLVISACSAGVSAAVFVFAGFDRQTAPGNSGHSPASSSHWRPGRTGSGGGHCRRLRSQIPYRRIRETSVNPRRAGLLPQLAAHRSMGHAQASGGFAQLFPVSFLHRNAVQTAMRFHAPFRVARDQHLAVALRRRRALDGFD